MVRIRPAGPSTRHPGSRPRDRLSESGCGVAMRWARSSEHVRFRRGCLAGMTGAYLARPAIAQQRLIPAPRRLCEYSVTSAREGTLSRRVPIAETRAARRLHPKGAPGKNDGPGRTLNQAAVPGGPNCGAGRKCALLTESWRLRPAPSLAQPRTRESVPGAKP